MACVFQLVSDCRIQTILQVRYHRLGQNDLRSDHRGNMVMHSFMLLPPQCGVSFAAATRQGSKLKTSMHSNLFKDNIF